VDVNAGHGFSSAWATFHWETSFLDYVVEPNSFDLLVCFEVLEHMDKAHGVRLIEKLINVAGHRGAIMLSTPVFKDYKAANHVYEWSAVELHKQIESLGGKILSRFGTFANIKDIRGQLNDHERKVFASLSEYFNNDALSCIFAPLYPNASRNNLWIVGNKETEEWNSQLRLL